MVMMVSMMFVFMAWIIMSFFAAIISVSVTTFHIDMFTFTTTMFMMVVISVFMPMWFAVLVTIVMMVPVMAVMMTMVALMLIFMMVIVMRTMVVTVVSIVVIVITAFAPLVVFIPTFFIMVMAVMLLVMGHEVEFISTGAFTWRKNFRTFHGASSNVTCNEKAHMSAFFHHKDVYIVDIAT